MVSEKDLIYRRELLLDKVDTYQLKLFHETFPRDPKKLYKKLKQSQPTLKEILNIHQLELVLPRGGNTYSEKFDTTLTCLLINNICHYKQPRIQHGEPEHWDKSKIADSIRLRNIRNKIHHHRSIGNITKELYDKWYKEACPPLKRLGCPPYELNNLQIKSKIANDQLVLDMPESEDVEPSPTSDPRWCMIL